MKKKEIGRAAIMGGTFDPVHYGHLLAAERVREEFSLDCIFFVPSGIPPHKNYRGMASQDDRYNMTKLSVSSNPFFEVLDEEIKREGYSYTIDTVIQLKKTLLTDCKLYFIIGTDNVRQILNWKNAQELIKEIEFIVVTRPGVWAERLENEVAVLKNSGCSINVVETPLIPIASTDIRDRVRNNLSIKYMVHDDIIKYIYKNNLYIW